MCKELRLSVANHLRELARVARLVTELLEREGVAAPVAYTTHLALEEVLSNVIRHAYPDSREHAISLVVRVARGAVEMEFVDDGREFDPLAAPEVDLEAPLEERQVGGLGIHLLRTLVSEIRYMRDGGKNRLWLRVAAA